MSKPCDFRTHPYDSVLKKTEAEVIARNIMVILARTGDTFRPLDWEEYERERRADAKTDKGGGFRAYKEKPFFDKVVGYCESEETARKFSPAWRDV